MNDFPFPNKDEVVDLIGHYADPDYQVEAEIIKIWELKSIFFNEIESTWWEVLAYTPTAPKRYQIVEISDWGDSANDPELVIVDDADFAKDSEYANPNYTGDVECTLVWELETLAQKLASTFGWEVIQD